MNRMLALLISLAAVGALIVGCESTTNAQADKEHKHDAKGGAKTAVAKVEPSKASTTQPANGQAKGTIEFHQSGDKVHIAGEITGLRPNAKHAIHIHEKGDLSAPDLMSTGGHYNPEKHQHGGPTTSKTIHAGDLGNLQADADGKAKMDLTVDNISLGGEKNDVIGKAVIIHAKEDDFKTQPTGNAGGRIGGGVIEMAK
ncbi:MAG: superoxide dismutase family protein [Tepidisphaeraceae bacterium]